ncbi:D-xylose transporter XylE [Oceanobacillus piezotolerans]|uniref:D-xylose transporter XylE n=1 Tax=Oceanobacillus piezotolerans TaxID=2448030 RepID=A0A498D8K5_9BACI|nr:D-xylose transporter XylE [Oceanobacillus piezotolerans]RLL47045.1 D-xylose transporter XylE [Oceanobacillus piezotolerans]
MKVKNKSYNNSYVISITLIATLGGLLFGYDTAVISGAEQSIQIYLIDSLGLGSFVHGLTVSSALIGCIIGGLISGFFSNSIGRRNSLIIAAILFFVSSLGSAYPEFLFFNVGEPTTSLLITFNLYRILGGIGVGMASAISPTYIGEIAPQEIRGKLVSWYQFAVIFGQLVVYFVNWGIANGQPTAWVNDIGWRLMFASEAIPALLFFILLFNIPETPRYLVSKNKGDQAFNVLSKINGSKEKAKVVLSEINESLNATTTTGKLFSYGKTVIIVGILLSVFQQFIGINVALYYAPRIFESMGAGQNASMMQTVIMGIVNVGFTIIAIQTVDKWGRKPLLMVGSIGMAIGMFGVALLALNGVFGIWTLFFIIFYTASFMMSWGPICWVLLSEIFPNKIRGQAMAFAVAAQWAANFFISSTYPPMIEFSGPLTYGFYGLMSIISAIFVWKMVPETKGRSLEQLESLWTGEKEKIDENKNVGSV